MNKLSEAQEQLIKQQDDLKNQINNHFALLSNLIANRKDTLLHELDSLIAGKIEEVEDSFLTSQQLLPQVLNISFSDSLEIAIKAHGKLGEGSKSIYASLVSTLAGSTPDYADGKGTKAQFYGCEGIAFNPIDDCIYVCDFENNKIRKVTKSGDVSTFASVDYPVGIAYSLKQNCFVVSEWSTHTIKKILPSGEISLLAGCDEGYQDGVALKAKFNYPHGIAIDNQTGNIYVVDHANHVVRKIEPQGVVSTVAGTPECSGYSDDDKKSLFTYPFGLCLSQRQQCIYVCDNGNHKLRKIALDGKVSTICDIGYPASVGILPNGNIVLSSSNNQKLFKVVHSEKNGCHVEVFAGSGKQGEKDGDPLECSFHGPRGIAIDTKSQTLFVSDHDNHRVRSIKYELRDIK